MSARSRRPFTEDQIIRLLASRFATADALIEMGIGDDAAVFRSAGVRQRWVVTTDMLVENVDFRRDWVRADEIGHKSLAANLSDLAAMGALPRFCTVALALPPGIEKNWVMSFFRGLAALGRRHDTAVVGGDLSASPSGILICITALGAATKRGILYRSGGMPGDLLCVTGTLGKAAAGLKLLFAGTRRSRKRWESLALAALRTPEPRCAAGIWLARSGLVRCMMDLSDGLSADVPRLCRASGTGAEIYAWCLPVFRECAERGWDPYSLALHGGEDFELLFAVRPQKLEVLKQRYPRGLPPLTVVGALTERGGVRIVKTPGSRPEPLPLEGFDHFRHPGDCATRQARLPIPAHRGAARRIRHLAADTFGRIPAV
ncbi:MAG: thiamine-phosphate kinase [Acidobacteria bacterium]|nr:thiamine-phosphate kinase [Acidobacteriota bacterium]